MKVKQNPLQTDQSREGSSLEDLDYTKSHSEFWRQRPVDAQGHLRSVKECQMLGMVNMD